MKKPERKSIRLQNYDYAGAGMYFVTVGVQNWRCILGKVNNGTVVLSRPGKMVSRWISEIPEKFGNANIDVSVIMPNHIHMIVALVGADLCVGPGEHTGSPLPQIIQWFKTMSTNEYIKNVKQNSWPSFNKHFRQRNYYEHVIRNEHELYSIREYIIHNPSRWQFDRENLQGTPDIHELVFWESFQFKKERV